MHKLSDIGILRRVHEQDAGTPNSQCCFDPLRPEPEKHDRCGGPCKDASRLCPGLRPRWMESEAGNGVLPGDQRLQDEAAGASEGAEATRVCFLVL